MGQETSSDPFSSSLSLIFGCQCCLPEKPLANNFSYEKEQPVIIDLASKPRCSGTSLRFEKVNQSTAPLRRTSKGPTHLTSKQPKLVSGAHHTTSRAVLHDNQIHHFDSRDLSQHKTRRTKSRSPDHHHPKQIRSSVCDHLRYECSP